MRFFGRTASCSLEIFVKVVYNAKVGFNTEWPAGSAFAETWLILRKHLATGALRDSARRALYGDWSSLDKKSGMYERFWKLNLVQYSSIITRSIAYKMQ